MSVDTPHNRDEMVNRATAQKKTRRRPNSSLIFPAIGSTMTMPRL